MADATWIDLERVREAVRSRATYFLENATNVTLKKCRRILERDLGLEEKMLDQAKKDVHDIIDRALMGGMETDHPQSRKVEIESKRKEMKETKTKQARVKSKSTKPTDRKKHKSAYMDCTNVEEKNSGTRSARVEKLKHILKTATITISPNIYVKHKREDELYDALCGLLKKEGLSPNPTDREISAVRKRKQIERDLDGIDTSNIISTGRRRRTSADAQYTYEEKNESDEDEDESTTEPSSQLEEKNSDGSEPEDESPRMAPSHKRPHAQGQGEDTGKDEENLSKQPKRRMMVISDEED